jgi:hypothetical protein
MFGIEYTVWRAGIPRFATFNGMSLFLVTPSKAKKTEAWPLPMDSSFAHQKR